MNRVAPSLALLLVATPVSAYAQSAGGLSGAPAAAPAPPPADPATEPPKAEEDPVYRNDDPSPRRSGIVVAGLGGLSLVRIAGYPQDVKTLDKPGYRTATPAVPGATVGGYFGGAIAAPVNVGLFFQYTSLLSGDWSGRTLGGGLRVDLFPFPRTKGPLGDLGFAGSFGVGATSVKTTRAGDYPDAKGTQSFIGLSTFWEKRVGHLALGPELRVDYVPTTYASSVAATLALRVALYGGAPADAAP